VTPAGAGIKVFSPSGHQVAGPAVSKGSVLTAPISSTETGTFVVSWQVFAADTHPSRGAFRFVVDHPSANPYSSLLAGGEIGTATPLGLALQALARWVHFAGFALAFGVVGYFALTRSDQREHLLIRRLVGAGIALLIAAEPLAFLGQLVSLSFDGDTAVAVLASGFGRLLALRVGGALLVWALWAIKSPWPILGVGLGVALVDGAGAHAIQGLPGAGQVLVAIHVGAMGLWVGGLAAFLSAPDRRFGRIAAASLTVAIVSGLLLALTHIGLLSALLTTGYGRVLVIKVLVVGVALSLPLRRRRPLEFGVVLAILAAAALLGALPPPRQGKRNSATAELGLTFAGEACVELAEVLRLHEQRLSPGLHLDCARVVGRGGAVEHLLCHRETPRRKLLESGDVFGNRRIQLVVGNDPGCEPPGLSLATCDLPAEQKDLRGAAKADDARQQPTDAHVATGDPDAREEEAEARRFGEDADVGGGGDDRSRPGGDAVDGGDHRLWDLAQVAHTCACHASELVHAAGIHLEQLGDDLVDVAA